MQHTAIIPYGDGAGFVVDTELVIRPGGVLEQILKNRLALITVQSFDTLGEIAVYIPRLVARLRCVITTGWVTGCLDNLKSN